MSKAILKTASVLAFERKLANSDGLLSAGQWQDKDNTDKAKWSPVIVQEKAVRGTISNRLKNAGVSDPAKLDAEVQKANLQRVDMASLPFNTNTLRVTFTLRVLGQLTVPSVCNNQDYQVALAEKINLYHQQHGFLTLATRYAENLANGRFLWRNRVGAEAVEVHITHKINDIAQKTWKFSHDEFNLREFSQPSSQLIELAEVIRLGLTGDAFVFLQIDGFAQLGVGQEVFPSQELVLDEGGNKKGKKSKVLYQREGQAAMHSQKIGNALRTIDTWHSAADELGPIAIEPYGAVTSRGKAYRQSKDSFFTLLDEWILKDKTPPPEQQHYVIATLIRGGVFGESEKPKEME